VSAPSTGTWTTGPSTGDGTTFATRARSRWRVLRWWVVGLCAIGLAVAALAVMRPAGTTITYDPANTEANGSRALAQVLGDQGVEVHPVTTVADAVAAAGPGTTLLVAPAPLLLPAQADALAAVPADVVLAGPGEELLATATDDQVRRGAWAPLPPAFPAEPACDLPAAVAAGTLVLAPALEADPGVTTCWPDGDGMAVLAAVETDGRSVVAVDDPSFLFNDTVTQEGNAALALHLLGGNDRLVWLVQDPADTSMSGDGPQLDTAGMLPPWADAAAWLALLVALVAAVWRARRLGPLVTEDLPVVVPAAETTRGRARLYRRSRARGHAAAALRASTAERIARRLGLARSATPATFVDAVVRATGQDPRAIDDLLYGPPPADDAALSELARRLDTLESEVHRP
jgi:hypothetical protein